jgi:hypothetical protein
VARNLRLSSSRIRRLAKEEDRSERIKKLKEPKRVGRGFEMLPQKALQEACHRYSGILEDFGYMKY